MNAPRLPPLLQGEAVTVDPFTAAQSRAIEGVAAGRLLHALDATTLRAALILAPEVPLRSAVAMFPLCAVGLQNALGALAPPELAVHLDWDGGLVVNGAACGGLRVAAATRDAEAVPDWLVLGLDLPLWPETEETGQDPDRTALYAEGCADLDPVALLEAWARHTLVWINRWETEGTAALHREWTELAHDRGQDVTILGREGTFLGVDEHFGMLLKTGTETRLIPLTDLLERP